MLLFTIAMIVATVAIILIMLGPFGGQFIDDPETFEDQLIRIPEPRVDTSYSRVEAHN